MTELLTLQYQDVLGARNALFNYCRTIDETDLFKPVEAFNGSNMGKLLVHNANVYLHWLQYFDQETSGPYFDEEPIDTIEAIAAVYRLANDIVAAFITKYRDNYLQTFSKHTPGSGILVTTTPLQLFTHTITHEFHHKGQILTMSRLLGYIPVDTDVIRT